MQLLTSHEALALTAKFVLTADRMRSVDSGLQIRAKVYETASRIAFLRAHLLARSEETRPKFGEFFRRAAFAVA